MVSSKMLNIIPYEDDLHTNKNYIITIKLELTMFFIDGMVDS